MVMRGTRPARPATPLVVEAPGSGGFSRALTWLSRSRADLRAALPHHGAVLVRGLAVTSPTDVVAVRDALGVAPVTAQEPFAPRRRLATGVFCDLLPREQTICPQHEQSYSLTIPRLLLMACLRPATAGGEVLLADARQVLAHLPARLVDRLGRLGWIMIRNFRDRVGVSWQEAFAASDRRSLEATLRRLLISHRWRPDGCLLTARLRPGIIHHPLTGEACWFNHASFFNELALAPAERQVLRGLFPDGLMLNTLLGDGSPFTATEIAVIDQTYQRLSVPVALAAGDVLLLDNLATANGRAAFSGDREVLLATGDPVPLSGCAPPVPPGTAREYLMSTGR